MNGIVFNIQRFCINDGPGIRTTVFLKGCPMRCMWCHNPESQLSKIEIASEDGKKEICGKYMTVKNVIDEVVKDKTFYKNSGGGITVSGGEPLMQPEFTYKLLEKAKLSGIHTCIETCGFAKTEDILKVAKVTDVFLYDWKITNNTLHQQYIGAGNDLILKNLKLLDKNGFKIILRCPIIPNVNDNDEHFKSIAGIANSLNNILSVEIAPYHSLGINKYKKFGKSNDLCLFEQPTEKQVENWINLIQKQTKVVVKKA